MIFAAAAGEPVTELTARIEAGLQAALGYAVPVFLRTASEVRPIAAHRPFAAPSIEASKGKLQVAMLSAKPAAKARKQVLALAERRGPARVRRARAALAAERRHPRLGARLQSDRSAARSDDDPHEGHDRAARGQVLRRLREIERLWPERAGRAMARARRPPLLLLHVERSSPGWSTRSATSRSATCSSPT